MSMNHVDTFHIIGLAIRTTNENNQSANDIPPLWNRFMTEQVSAKIPNKLGDEIYCVYTEYESDHTQSYTTVIGCRVANLNDVPEGFKGITINGGNFQKFTTKGNLMEGIIWQAWVDIWKTEIERTYTSDYEVYGAKALDPKDAEVDIFVAV